MTQCRTGRRTVHSNRIGGVSCKLMANGTEKVILKAGLEGVLLLSKATFVSLPGGEPGGSILGASVGEFPNPQIWTQQIAQRKWSSKLVLKVYSFSAKPPLFQRGSPLPLLRLARRCKVFVWVSYSRTQVSERNRNVLCRCQVRTGHWRSTECGWCGRLTQLVRMAAIIRVHHLSTGWPLRRSWAQGRTQQKGMEERRGREGAWCEEETDEVNETDEQEWCYH